MRCLVKSNFTRSLAVFKKIPNKTIFFLTISYKFSDLDNLIDVLMVYELVFHIHDWYGLRGHFTYQWHHLMDRVYSHKKFQLSLT